MNTSTQSSPSKHTGTSSNDGGGSVFEIGGKRRRPMPNKVRTNKRRVVATKRPLVSVSSSQSQHEESQKRKKKRKSPPRLSLHRRVSASSVRMVSDSQGSTQSLQQQPKNTSDALRNVLRRDEENDEDVELRRHRERPMAAIEEEEEEEEQGEDEDKSTPPMEDPVVPKSSQEVTYSKDTKKSAVETVSSSQVDLNQEMKVLARSSRTSRHRDPLAALLK